MRDIFLTRMLVCIRQKSVGTNAYCGQKAYRKTHVRMHSHSESGNQKKKKKLCARVRNDVNSTLLLLFFFIWPLCFCHLMSRFSIFFLLPLRAATHSLLSFAWENRKKSAGIIFGNWHRTESLFKWLLANHPSNGNVISDNLHCSICRFVVVQPHALHTTHNQRASERAKDTNNNLLQSIWFVIDTFVDTCATDKHWLCLLTLADTCVSTRFH